MHSLAPNRHRLPVPGGRNGDSMIDIDLARMEIPAGLASAASAAGIENGAISLTPDMLKPEGFRAIQLLRHGHPDHPNRIARAFRRNRYQPGEFGLDTVPDRFDPLKLYAHSFGPHNITKRSWPVLLKPLVVGLCPTDTAGGAQEFPVGNVRQDGVPGHEIVFSVVGVHPNAIEELRAKGIELGDIVVGDINIGCGGCAECDLGRAGINCANTLTFAGVGGAIEATRWVQQQIGLDSVPGGYTEGTAVMPVSALTKVDGSIINTREELALFSQADALACAYSSMREMDIHPTIDNSFGQIRRFALPKFLIIGLGRLGLWHGHLIRRHVPNAIICAVDKNEDNLNRAGDFLDISPEHRHLLSDTDASKNGRFYSAENISRAFPDIFKNGGRFHFAIDCAGHGVIKGPTLDRILDDVIAGDGAHVTTAHTGIPNGEKARALSGKKNMGNKKVQFALSPKEFMRDAVAELERNIKEERGGPKSLSNMITFLRGGLDHSHEDPRSGDVYSLPQIIGHMPSGVKERMDGTVFVSDLLPDLDRLQKYNRTQIAFLACVLNATNIQI